ncbi:hypothetical protein PV797_16065 [Clostridiaceae bacterium M8S5]|nr:hypothetical protein PV797_16065 [Clostridiaceae bacterium M8S5]
MKSLKKSNKNKGLTLVANMCACDCGFWTINSYAEHVFIRH